MRVSTLLFLFLSSFLFSCTQADNNKADTLIVSTSEINSQNLSIIALDERLHAADSLVFVFYKDPQGKDSLRYTRFYKQYASIDTNLIKFVKDNLQDSTTRFEKIKNCRSEGKIWCFTKGEIFQTIYFSSFSSDCSFLYIIKNGQFYYSAISSAMSKNLNELETKAVDPDLQD